MYSGQAAYFVCLMAALLALVLSSCGGGGDVPITTPRSSPDGVPR